MTDETPDVVQPEQGQGDEGTSSTPYAEYLDRIPEEVRGEVEPVFKDWDANTTRKFQEAAREREQWKPYEELGVNNHSPEAVQWALQFYDAAQNNPQSIQEWFQDYANQHGLAAAQQAAADLGQQQAPQQGLDDFGVYQDPATQQLLEQQLKSALGPIQQQLEQLSGWRQQQEQQTREQAALRMIEGQIDALKKEHGSEFNEQAVEKLVVQYIETDPQHAVQRAWSDYQSLVNQIQKDTLQAKVNQPAPAESGGLANGAPEQIKTLADASRIALERLSANRQV